MIKLAERDLKTAQLRNKSTRREKKKLSKGSTVSDHQDSLEREDRRELVQSNEHHIAEQEEEKEGGEATDNQEEAKDTPSTLRPNTAVKMSKSLRLRRQAKENEAPDSPLPVIYINDNVKFDHDRTDEATPKDQAENGYAKLEDDEALGTDRQLKSSRKSKNKKTKEK